ncbi:MAG: hypothetical protein LBC89_03130 [Bacteroidales bacterium]|jgi:beta-lactamase regulating signal transducer with metallopeptidase domain|nr:hypothetical protein [Bacteroidales bacterium]
MDELFKGLLGDICLYITYALVIVAILAMLAFSVIQVINNFKKAKIGLLGFLAVIVLFLIYYFCFSSTIGVSQTVLDKTNTSEFWVKITDSGLVLTYALAAIGLLAWIASYIYVKVKK